MSCVISDKRENAGDSSAIGFTLKFDRLSEWREFS